MVSRLTLIPTSHPLLDYFIVYGSEGMRTRGHWNSGVTLFTVVTNGHTRVTCLVVHKSQAQIA
jgi:hypothetical protein